MYGMFVKAQRIQEIITILDNGAKIFYKNLISLECRVTADQIRIMKEKDTKSFVQVHSTFKEDIGEK